MKLKKICLTLLLSVSTLYIYADTQYEKVQQGIARIERLCDAHQWHDAFVKLYELESQVAKGDNTLLYLTAKERLHMYQRLNKGGEVMECMGRMETLALKSNDAKTIEDMLFFKASLYAAKGNTKVSRDCYLDLFNRRVGNQNGIEREQVFTSMIAEAKKDRNKLLEEVVSGLYTAWQDSIASVCTEAELKELKVQYSEARRTIEEKDGKIGFLWGTILLLGSLLIGVSVALLIAFLILLRNRQVTSRLRSRLKVSETNSQQKSTFIRNITQQVNPSLREIAAGHSQVHIQALEGMLRDVETYIALDESKDQPYETAEVSVSKVCEQAAIECAQLGVPVAADAPKLSFPICEEAVRELLRKLLHETSLNPHVERITIAFKKRNPHIGQFTVTAIGMKLDEAQQETLFIAFARICDLTVSTGLVYPICALMAHKMKGSLSLDDSFAKGTRFILEVHC